MNLGIEGRRAAVAGASAWLGLAAAMALAAEGVHVAICGRDRDRINAAADKVGGGCVPIVADVHRGGSIRLGNGSSGRAGRVDILVANAGRPLPGDLAKTSLETFARRWTSTCSRPLQCARRPYR